MPFTLKENETDYLFVKLFTNVHVVEAENEPFLYGQDTFKEWKAVLNMGDDTVTSLILLLQLEVIKL